MQHVSLPKKKKKNQYIDFFTYIIYIIYYNIITLLWDEFETIIRLTKNIMSNFDAQLRNFVTSY